MRPQTLSDRFDLLCLEAASCRRCPALADKIAVLSQLNGTLTPKVFFVAEAPGRHGADRTRRPFYGDKSGDNLQTLLDSIGLSRDDVFITNAVMCSPRKSTDANRKPNMSEIRNCSDFLRKQIGLIRPAVVATLGNVALNAVKRVQYHDLNLRESAGRAFDWNGGVLVPLYHPSPQVIASQRGLELQLRHFQQLTEFI